MLTREQILGARPVLGSLEVPEWGGAVAIRRIGALDVAALSDEQDSGRRTVLMVRFGVAAEDGQPLFTAEDDAWLAQQPWDLTLRVARAVAEHSGISAPAEAIAGN